MYALLVEGRKPVYPVLQLIFNTCQADSLYRVIDHPSQYECSHWMYICIAKIFNYGLAATFGYDKATPSQTLVSGHPPAW